MNIWNVWTSQNQISKWPLIEFTASFELKWFSAAAMTQTVGIRLFSPPSGWSAACQCNENNERMGELWELRAMKRKQLENIWDPNRLLFLYHFSKYTYRIPYIETWAVFSRWCSSNVSHRHTQVIGAHGGGEGISPENTPSRNPKIWPPPQHWRPFAIDRVPFILNT